MVATVHTHMGLTANRMTMMVCMDQLVQATRAKIQDVRSDCPGRPIILVGFNAGAALACQVIFFYQVSKLNFDLVLLYILILFLHTLIFLPIIDILAFRCRWLRWNT